MVKVTEMVFIPSDTDLCRHMAPQQNEEYPCQQKEARGKGETTVLNPVLPGKQKEIANEKNQQCAIGEVKKKPVTMPAARKKVK